MGDSLRISHGRGILEIHHSSTNKLLFFLPTLSVFLLWFFSISSILLSISDFKNYWYINLGSFAGFYLTNIVQTTNIMSISLLKRKRLLLSQRRLKHQKVVRGTISLLFSIILTSVQVLMLYALVNAVNSGIASFKAPGGTHRSSFEQKSNYQTPASALYGAYEGSSSQGSSSSYGKICIHCFLVFFPSLDPTHVGASVTGSARFLVFFICYLANPSIFFTCRIRSVLSQTFLTLTINFKKSMLFQNM